MTDQTGRTKVAIIGSGNIGTDLMIKIMRNAQHLEMAAMVGIDPNSDGLARAAKFGFEAISTGVDGLLESPQIDEIGIVFDATSAGAHQYNNDKLAPLGIRMIDLTPAAIGPYTIPAVNLEEHIEAPNVNMVTCGGQATIPIVAAISRVVPVAYGEIVASIASKSAGPGTRANIDEFTETTSAAIEKVGGARRGKAIIILNPAEPPLMMRDTVFALVALPEGDDVETVKQQIKDSVAKMVADVAAYVPGYQMVQEVQITAIPEDQPVQTLLVDGEEITPTHQVSVFLKVEGAGMYLPAYAGNLDIMTSAAVQMAEKIAANGNPRLAAAGAGKEN
ncbi:acetaldehyde dehydrogenase (acetylating) [Nocardioides sp. DS6]|uniref:Acetaldehyde dehydrogenase n=1 Tax=Nocardioides eburneus TaxID=3231482 RepID=A0ABV3SWH9_9ACTN